MKFLTVFTLLALVSCHNHKKTVIQQVENPFDNSQNEARFTDLEQRVAVLESSVTLNISQIQNNSATISLLQSQFSSEIISLQEEIADLQNQLNQTNLQGNSNSSAILDAQQQLQNLQEQLNSQINQSSSNYTALQNSINTLTSSNQSLQNSVNSLLSQMTQLQTQQTVVQVVDPCPNVTSNSYKEVLLKLSSGQLVAYFENSGDRFLTVLKPGNYRTTDSRECSFSVDANNVLH